MSSKPSTTKAFSHGAHSFCSLMPEHSWEPVLVLSYLIGQGAGETSFLEPNTVSKMKTHLQVLLRRNKRKKMEKN